MALTDSTFQNTSKDVHQPHSLHRSVLYVIRQTWTDRALKVLFKAFSTRVVLTWRLINHEVCFSWDFQFKKQNYLLIGFP